MTYLVLDADRKAQSDESRTAKHLIQAFKDALQFHLPLERA